MVKGLRLGVFAAILLSAQTAFATDNNGSGPSKEQLEQVCVGQKAVCNSVCPADDGTFSGGLVTDLCKDDCQRKYVDCLGSIEAKKKKGSVTKRRNGNSDEVLSQ